MKAKSEPEKTVDTNKLDETIEQHVARVTLVQVEDDITILREQVETHIFIMCGLTVLVLILWRRVAVIEDQVSALMSKGV